jgi:hypothetical protein
MNRSSFKHGRTTEATGGPFLIFIAPSTFI